MSNINYHNSTRKELGSAVITDLPNHMHLRPVIVDREGSKHVIVGYSTTHNYVTKTEQVVQYHSPTTKEFYKDYEHVLVPWSSSGHDHPHKSNDQYSPKIHNQVYETNSPRSGDHHHYGKYNDDDDDDDYTPKKGGRKPNYMKDDDYDKGKHKSNGYVSPSYTVQSRQDHKYYDHITSPPIKMRSDQISRGVETKNSPRSYIQVHQHQQHPHYNGSPRKDHQHGYQESYDRHGKGSPRIGAYVEEKNTGIIDSRMAAQLYNGVLLES